ncbi:uncharacterized protein B0I36DRAFT_255353 [Microdochium trichocladiopsis]|uniref:Carbohydrate esterase family 16 protein n=1 Tax=Microdochium trichocladiopsis TaxID=1682393 RepID=A0A9P9BI81_9PEZI|nr:uncharacterized protein B0I36DRAFT_255353 [Microdochium trichocladiopsis]KAH7014100.1 hypothetical protein B0I36DRAFT_255353 [Microdochium trichocladiopsis]
MQKGCASTPNWKGLAKIKYAFTLPNPDNLFLAGFNFTGTPPAVGNPLGNPPYPGWTSANGPNWVDFLTVKYNTSQLLTYNLAYGGATVDSDLIAPYDPSVLSLKYQVNSEFVPGYTGSSPKAPSAPKWSGKDSLFVVWIGINDVGNSWWTDYTTLWAKVFAEYTTLVNTLYAKGARNIVFVDVPPVDRSPQYIQSGDYAVENSKIAIAKWNDLVKDMAKKLKTGKPDANVWVYSSAADFNKVLDNPTSFTQTSALKVLDKYCADYQNGTPAKDTFIATCGVPVNEYFWLNALHPTYPIHDVVAQQLAKTVAAGPNIC